MVDVTGCVPAAGSALLAYAALTADISAFAGLSASANLALSFSKVTYVKTASTGSGLCNPVIKESRGPYDIAKKKTCAQSEPKRNKDQYGPSLKFSPLFIRFLILPFLDT